jgi:hypothetical protein
VRFEARVLGAMLLVIVGTIAVIYELRHPCFRYSSHRVFVEEFTTYIATDASVPIGGVTAAGRVSVPITTPPHFEDEMVCEERK